jgi:hypothetical protein
LKFSASEFPSTNENPLKASAWMEAVLLSTSVTQISPKVPDPDAVVSFEKVRRESNEPVEQLKASALATPLIPNAKLSPMIACQIARRMIDLLIAKLSSRVRSTMHATIITN